MNFLTFQTFKEVTMAKLSTHETEVKYATSFTVMSSGDVIIWGEGPKGILKKMFGNPRAFYVYNKSGGKWKRTQILEPLCRHLKPYLLPVKVKGEEEQLAVSCVDCKAIRLYNLKTGNSTVVFRHVEYRPGRMCHGKPGRIFVLAGTEKAELLVLELDYTKGDDEFHIHSKAVTERLYRHYNGMVTYVPSQKEKYVVVSSNIPKKTIRSIPFDKPAPFWEHWYGGWERQIDGTEFSPSGMVYSPRHEGLLVADRMNSRVVVLNPVSGNHVQTVPLDDMVGLLQMCLHGDQIIVWHNEDPFKKKEKISYISMPMFSWDKIPEAPPE